MPKISPITGLGNKKSTGRSSILQEYCRGIYRIYLALIKEKKRDHNMDPVGSGNTRILIDRFMPKNLPDTGSRFLYLV